MYKAPFPVCRIIFPYQECVYAVHYVASLGEDCTHLQRNIMVSLVEHLLGKPQAAVHPRYEEGGGGGRTGVVARTTLPETTRPCLQKEGTIHCVLKLKVERYPNRDSGHPTTHT